MLTTDFVSSALTPEPTNHKDHIGRRMVRLETTLFLRQDPHALAVRTEAASDDLQQYLAGVL